jgi:hypothetical protein
MADVSVGFYIKDIFAHKLEKQDPMDNTAEPDTVKVRNALTQWNFSKVVPFQMDELQLRRNFLHVYVNHEEGQGGGYTVQSVPDRHGAVPLGFPDQVHEQVGGPHMHRCQDFADRRGLWFLCPPATVTLIK